MFRSTTRRPFSCGSRRDRSPPEARSSWTQQPPNPAWAVDCRLRGRRSARAARLPSPRRAPRSPPMKATFLRQRRVVRPLAARRSRGRARARARRTGSSLDERRGRLNFMPSCAAPAPLGELSPLRRSAGPQPAARRTVLRELGKKHDPSSLAALRALARHLSRGAPPAELPRRSHGTIMIMAWYHEISPGGDAPGGRHLRWLMMVN